MVTNVSANTAIKLLSNSLEMPSAETVLLHFMLSFMRWFWICVSAADSESMVLAYEEVWGLLDQSSGV